MDARADAAQGPAVPAAARLDPRRQRSRARALAAAADLLLEGGLSALTVDGVVERSGVAKTTVYRHWATRRDLVQDALWRLAPAPADISGEGPLRERLSAHLLSAATLFMARPVLPALIETALRDPELLPFHDDFVAAQLGGLRTLLATAQEAGDLGSGVSAEELLALGVGALMTRTGLLRQDVRRGDADRVADLLLALAAAPAPSAEGSAAGS